MPFGTEKIAESSKELGDKVDALIDSMRVLNQGTAQLAQTTSQFGDAMKIFTEQMVQMNARFHELSGNFTTFQTEMQAMTQQIRTMAEATQGMQSGMTEELKALNGTLHDLGKHMTVSMVENVKDSLSLNKILKKIVPDPK
jgi:methyl-accepting chemotaxis protein